MMNLIPAIKLGAGVLTSFGAGAVIGNAIKATTPETLKLGTKILVATGGFVIAAAAGELAANYVEGTIQGTVDGVRAGRATMRLFRDGVKEAAADTAADFKDFKVDIQADTSEFVGDLKDTGAKLAETTKDALADDADDQKA